MSTEKPVKKPFPLRLGLFIILILLILGGIAYGYYWYTTTVTKAQQADQVILNAQNYDVISREIEKEYARCQGFIAQEQGGFGEFEYCKRFINWVNVTNQEIQSAPKE